MRENRTLSWDQSDSCIKCLNVAKPMDPINGLIELKSSEIRLLLLLL